MDFTDYNNKRYTAFFTSLHSTVALRKKNLIVYHYVRILLRSNLEIGKIQLFHTKIFLTLQAIFNVWFFFAISGHLIKVIQNVEYNELLSVQYHRSL